MPTTVDIKLNNAEQEMQLRELITGLSKNDKHILQNLSKDSTISAFVDGRGLACPLPLLKTKVALRGMNDGESVYVLATDPNSQVDLDAFCKHTGLEIVLNTSVNIIENNKTQNPNNIPLRGDSGDDLEKLNTIFHLIITKTHGK